MSEHDSDIHRLWHEQAREAHEISIDDVRVKSDQFEQGVSRWNVFGALLSTLLIGVEGWQVWREQELVERAGDLLTMAALIYVAYGFWTHASAQFMPAGLGRTSCVDFYRKQLARQRDLGSHPWRYLVLFVPGVGLSLLGHSLDRPPAQTAAIVAVGVALFLTVAWLNRRTARRLQREIDELV